MQIGAVHVPIYPTISAEDYEYILKHAGIKYVFVSGNEIIRKIGHILKAVENINDVYSFTHVEGYKHFNEIIEFGKQNQDLNKIEKIKTSINKDDIATLIYT